MTPDPVSVRQLPEDTGVSGVTPYKWKKYYRNRGIAVPSDQNKRDTWSAEDKLAVVIETAVLNEVQLSGYCRNKWLYPEPVSKWKESALAAYQQSAQVKKDKLRSCQEDKKTIKRLEKQLHRKDKALAETAALRVLSKKHRRLG